MADAIDEFRKLSEKVRRERLRWYEYELNFEREPKRAGYRDAIMRCKARAEMCDWFLNQILEATIELEAASSAT